MAMDNPCVSRSASVSSSPTEVVSREHPSLAGRFRSGMETTNVLAPSAAPLLTIPDVAAILRCTRRTVERQIAGRHLRVLRLGRSVRIEPGELERFLSALREGDDAG